MLLRATWAPTQLGHGSVPPPFQVHCEGFIIQGFTLLKLSITFPRQVVHTSTESRVALFFGHVHVFSLKGLQLLVANEHDFCEEQATRMCCMPLAVQNPSLSMFSLGYTL